MAPHRLAGVISYFLILATHSTLMGDRDDTLSMAMPGENDELDANGTTTFCTKCWNYEWAHCKLCAASCEWMNDDDPDYHGCDTGWWVEEEAAPAPPTPKKQKSFKQIPFSKEQRQSGMTGVMCWCTMNGKGGNGGNFEQCSAGISVHDQAEAKHSCRDVCLSRDKYKQGYVGVPRTRVVGGVRSLVPC